MTRYSATTVHNSTA